MVPIDAALLWLAIAVAVVITIAALDYFTRPPIHRSRGYRHSGTRHR